MENYFDQLEDFIKGKLSPTEKLIFEQRLPTVS